MINQDKFIKTYIGTALWSSTYSADKDGKPMSSDEPGASETPMDENYSEDDIAKETIEQMCVDCVNFIRDNETLLTQYTEAGQSSEQAGHDFWLTRNGHGAGFWDRGLGKLGDDLSAAARPYGSFDLYIGDDGKVHGS